MNHSHKSPVRCVRRWHLAVIVLTFGALAMLTGESRAADVASLIKSLSAGPPTAAHDAADDLANLGAAAQPAVEALIEALRSPDVELRWRAARALAGIGPDAKAASLGLIGALGDSETQVRAEAAYALGRLGQPTPEVVHALAGRITDPEAAMRRAVLRALRTLKPDPDIVRPAYVKALESADPNMVAMAIQSVAEQGEAAVDRLKLALQYPESQYWACLALAEIGPKAASATPALFGLLSNPRPEVVLQALVALAQIGADPAVAAEKVTPLLADERLSVQYGAAFCLGKLRAGPAAQQLEALSSSASDPLLKTICTWAVANIRPDDATATRATALLLEALKSPDAKVRSWVATGLGELTGPASADALAGLVAVLTDADSIVAANAAASLATAGSRAVPELLTALADTKRREIALNILSRIGPAASEAASGLAAALTDPDAEYRREVLFTLARIGQGAAPVASLIAERLQDQEMRVRYAACFALGNIGPGAKSAASALEAGTKSDDPFLAVASHWALLKVLPGDAAVEAAAIPRLAKALPSLPEMPKLEILWTFGQLGPKASAAREAVEACVSDADAPVRDAARQTLEKIGK
jgi:HEAT repeat protein